MFSREDLLRSLGHLDKILVPAIRRAEKQFGVRYGEEACFRGLFVESKDALRCVEHQCDRNSVIPDELAKWPEEIANDPLYKNLRASFSQFNPIDFGLLLLALAPEYQSCYEQVFGFLQDDVTRRRVSVELAIGLFDPLGNLGAAGRLNDCAALQSNRMIELASPPDGRTGWAAKILRLDEQFFRLLHGFAILDSRLDGIAEVVHPRSDLLRVSISEGLRRTLEQLSQTSPVRLHLHGPDGRLNLRVAEGLARQLKKNLLVVEIGLLTASARSPAELTRILLREASWFKHLVVVVGLDSLLGTERQHNWEQFTSILSRHAGASIIFTGSHARLPPTPHPLGTITVEIALPDADECFEHWTNQLTAAKISLGINDIKMLAERYTLTRSQIELSVADAGSRAKLRNAQACPPRNSNVSFDDLAIAARNQGGRNLELLANKITPQISLKDVVVSDDVQAQLHEIASRVRNRGWVLREWGFAHRRSYGLGVNALFAARRARAKQWRRKRLRTPSAKTCTRST
ncbi:hypothetical protein [Zavarzinella formosa]|uniref:hypothetical protein n=1 Tax=Zavarzinella formosa TaxID=360055 RepID=UPI00030C497E